MPLKSVCRHAYRLLLNVEVSPRHSTPGAIYPRTNEHTMRCFEAAEFLFASYAKMAADA
jgi:hypothetical protein